MPTPSSAATLSVSQLVNTLKNLIEAQLPMVWVEGELSNLARPASGHLYFTLKDAGAQVRCAMFRPRAGLLRMRPQDGMQVLLRARITLYEARGDLQLVVEHMEDAGLGALQRAYEILRQRLSTEGLFDARHKHSLPALPRRIGIITSPSGAAVRDVLHVLARRFPLIPLRIYPSSVQGASAASELVAALQQAQTEQQCEVLLLVRGGGSLEDLQAFNNEALARAIHACTIPLISGVGHETDTTIADFVADARAPTPSAAAALAAPDMTTLLEQIGLMASSLQRRIRDRIESRVIRLDNLSRHLANNHPHQRLRRMRERMQALAARLDNAQSRFATQRKHRIEALRHRLLSRHPAQTLDLLSARTRALQERLHFYSQNTLNRQQAQLQQFGARLHVLSPLATLARGYTILERMDGQVITHGAPLQYGQHIKARLVDAVVRCEVQELESIPVGQTIDSAR